MRKVRSGQVVVRMTPGSYCRVCATDKTREWRQNSIRPALSPEEWELIQELRRAEPAGRHHAGGRS
jgi:hypothetical protein